MRRDGAAPVRWAQLALHPPRGLGQSLGAAVVRTEIDDFLVDEELPFTASGQGQHVLLRVRKRDSNTQWVARSLARIAGCRSAEVGYAGLKDRRAIATQWFTVPRAKLTPQAWLAVSESGFEVLAAEAHSRKMPRGAHGANRFVVRLRSVQAGADVIEQRLAQIRTHGVPNYFGPQRFGRDCSNLVAIGSETLERRSPERGFVLSAARSLIFNAVLADRVEAGTWDRLEAGDVANLDGRGSLFAVDTVDGALQERCLRLEVHPTGPMWGLGASLASGNPAEREHRVAAELSDAARLVESAGLEPARRALRLAVRDLEMTVEDGAVVIGFRLCRGGFATTVLREVFDLVSGTDALATEEEG